jgi:plasmid stability protein
MRRADLLRRDLPDTADAEQELRRQLRTLRDLDGTFGTDGWELLDRMLATEEENARQQVEGAARGLEEIYAQRERLTLIRWFRGLPEANLRERARIEQELESYQPREDE